MKTIFETCDPRPDVLSGELREEVFAARLHDVVEDKGEDVYRDAASFFENTYPTEGLRSLLSEVFGRLSGARPASKPIIRLETSFGGGKTHNLIACYHVADGRGDGAVEKGLLDRKLLPPAAIPVAGVVGSELDPANPLDRGGAHVRTPWGELAYQLAGPEEAARIEEAGTAPGKGTLDKLIGDEPTLVMLDEMAWYLRVAKGYEQGELARQTVAFLMSLLELAASKERFVVVLSLADSSDAFGRESDEIREELTKRIPRAEESEELKEAKRVTARQEHIVTPTADDEIPRIVVHRLFERVDRSAAGETAGAYLEAFRALVARGADLPPRATTAEYAHDIELDYPLHPEFINTLTNKTATIPNFQKTRGALRLLAMTVRRLWEQQPAETHLIHLHHLDLSIDDIANDLTSRLDRPEFKSVIRADIVSATPGSPSHAEEVDEQFISAGKPPYAQRAATSIFVHSLTLGAASGVDPADLALAVLASDDEHGLLDKALEQLTGPGGAWFLHWDERRYRFGTEPSPAKVIFDEKSLVGRLKAKEELDRRIAATWSKGSFDVKAFPNEPSDVSDDAGAPKLAVLHYDAASVDDADEATPDLAIRISERAGVAEGFRTYRNNVVFLAADADRVERAIDAAQEYLATRRVVSDPERLAPFSDEQRKRLREMLEESDLQLRTAVVNTYRHVYYASAGAAEREGRLAHDQLAAQEPDQAKRDQTAALVEVLAGLDKVLRADDQPKSPAWIKSRAWDAGKEEMSAEDLRRAFARKIALPILLDTGQLKRTIKVGVQTGSWVYYDARQKLGYGKDSPAPSVELSEDAVLYAPEEARRRKIPVAGEEREVEERRCPVCGNLESKCTCTAPGTAPGLRGEGTATQALTQIADIAAEQRIESLAGLRVRLDGSGTEGSEELAALALAVPQLGKADVGLRVEVTAEFDGGEHFQLDLDGSWERYKRVKQVAETFAREATQATVAATLRLQFPEPIAINGDEWRQIREALGSLPLGKVTTEADAAAAGPVEA